MLSNPQVEGFGIGTVLIVEDEALVSVMMEDFLLDLGASEVIVCGTPDEARSRIGNRSVHCAILDVKVGGVSMVLTRRSEFNSYIRNHGGQVEPLIAELEARAKR